MTQWNKEAFKLKSEEKDGFIVSKHNSSFTQKIYTLTIYIMIYNRLAYRIFISSSNSQHTVAKYLEGIHFKHLLLLLFLLWLFIPFPDYGLP